MLELDGVKYVVKTPAENTQDMLDRINTYCTTNNIVNSKNETISIAANYTSPIYLILWALGYLVTVIQNLIYGVGKGISIQSSTDDQLLNLSQLAGVKRRASSVTTFDLLVYAMSETDTNYDATSNDGNLVITSENTITYQGVTYAPALHPSITIAPGEVGYITMVAQTSGSYQITEGTIDAFDVSIANLSKIQQSTSIPGNAQESIASLRERVQRRTYSGTSIDAATDGIKALPGVTTATIVYNDSISTEKFVGADSLSLPGRYAMVFVQGYNANIAEAFYQHLSAPTIEYSTDSFTGEITYNKRGIPDSRILEIQHYTTHSQQQIPVLVLKPKQQVLYVKVYLGMSIVGSLEEEIKLAVVAQVLSNTSIGESVTSVQILNALTDYSSYGILGVQIGADVNNLSYQTTQANDVIWTLSTSHVTIVMPEVAE